MSGGGECPITSDDNLSMTPWSTDYAVHRLSVCLSPASVLLCIRRRSTPTPHTYAVPPCPAQVSFVVQRNRESTNTYAALALRFVGGLRLVLTTVARSPVFCLCAKHASKLHQNFLHVNFQFQRHAGGQTDRQTDMLIAMLHSPTAGWSKIGETDPRSVMGKS